MIKNKKKREPKNPCTFVWILRSFFAVFGGLLVWQLYLFTAEDRAEPVSSSSSSNNNKVRKSKNTAVAAARKSKLADGCYHVLLDVGANIGVNARFLYEPHLYPKAHKVLALFDHEFGSSRDNRDLCVFAFEPNPAHRKRFENLTNAYTKMGWRYQHFMAGVSDIDGTMDFYHLHDEDKNEWGFSIFPRTDVKENITYEVEHVPVIRLAKWMWDEIWEREIPKKVYGDYSDVVKPGPKVLMKMDVEKMEYILVPDLFMSGALCNVVDLMYGEFHVWHSGLFPVNFPDNNLVLNNFPEGNQFYKSLNFIHQVARNCKTQLVWEDFEAYLYDGMPFPDPTETACG